MSAPVVTAVAAYVPPALALAQWSQIEHTLNATVLTGWARLVYPYWFAAYGRDLPQPSMPLDDTPSASWPAAPAGIAVETGIGFVPVEKNDDLSGLATDVAQTICAARAPEAPRIDVVMFCHSSLNEHVSTTTAGILRAAIGEPCFPFSIAQQQGASVFTALRLAKDLFVAEPELRVILIVAAEKWCHPFARRIGRWTLQGDAAGATLRERASPATHSRGLQLLDTAVQPLCRADAPFGLPASLIDTNAIFAPALLALIDALLRRHGRRAGEISAVIAHQVNRPLVEAVSRQLGLPRERHLEDRRAYLGAAES